MEYKNKALELQKKPFLSFGWEPDYENIGIYYQRAANVFANTDIPEAIQCYQLATDNLLKSGIIFEAAKCQELLAKLLKRNNKLSESVVAFSKAGDLFHQLTQNDTASDMYCNAAQVAEQNKNVDIAGNLYIRAVDTLVDNDKGILSHDMFKKSTGFFLRNKMIAQGIDLYKKQIVVLLNYKKPGIPKIQLTIVLLFLALKDVRMATDYLNASISNLGGSSASMALLGSANVDIPPELTAAQHIIDGYTNGDQKMLTSSINDYVMFLDVEVTKLANKISVGSANIPPPNPINISDIDENEGFA